jgi:hypothetical protein
LALCAITQIFGSLRHYQKVGGRRTSGADGFGNLRGVTGLRSHTSPKAGEATDQSGTPPQARRGVQYARRLPQPHGRGNQPFFQGRVGAACSVMDQTRGRSQGKIAAELILASTPLRLVEWSASPFSNMLKSLSLGVITAPKSAPNGHQWCVRSLRISSALASLRACR